ncbi:unnamed protein product [Nezara viridula]|uniref:Uncharacterized protein n=1 Tax=Nezara viridula TaxID=85310 RepID=A0A9P0HTS8_NEZVI|nr:unnamed protein product [Nezara viridula]
MPGRVLVTVSWRRNQLAVEEVYTATLKRSFTTCLADIGGRAKNVPTLLEPSCLSTDGDFLFSTLTEKWASVASWFMRPEGRAIPHQDSVLPPTVCTEINNYIKNCHFSFILSPFIRTVLEGWYTRDHPKEHQDTPLIRKTLDPDWQNSGLGDLRRCRTRGLKQYIVTI